MTKTNLFLATLTIAAAPLSAAPELTVRIYNYANVDAATVREAAESAREIYRGSGVETRWLICELPDREADFDDPCTDSAGPETLRMRIVARPPAKHDGVNHLVFGFALPKKDGFGTAASVFWSKISETAELSKVTAAQLLSTVMAHEAGHLLLGFNSHTGQGLMGARWDKARFTKISQGGLTFVGKQKKRVLAGAEARLVAQVDAD